MRTISVCGTGYSGSGAVLDLLSGYSSCHDICGDLEFFFLYFPDGVDDLTYHLTEGYSRFHSSDVAIARYKRLIKYLGKEGWNDKTNNQLQRVTSNFLNEIVQLEWEGNWIYDLFRTFDSKQRYYQYRLRRKCNSILRKHGKKGIETIPRRTMYLSIGGEGYLLSVKQYIRDIIASIYPECDDEGVILLNQSVPVNNISHFQKYFDYNKVIVVLRDPRDVYLNLKKVNSQNALWFPHDHVNEYIRYYKVLMDGVNKNINRDDVCVIMFEDLIYKTEETISKIESFIGNIGQFDGKACRFDPAKSIQNTQLFESFLEYKDDIREIEKELFDYLYVFPKDSKNIQHNAMF